MVFKFFLIVIQTVLLMCWSSDPETLFLFCLGNQKNFLVAVILQIQLSCAFLLVIFTSSSHSIIFCLTVIHAFYLFLREPFPRSNLTFKIDVTNIFTSVGTLWMRKRDRELYPSSSIFTFFTFRYCEHLWVPRAEMHFLPRK